MDNSVLLKKVLEPIKSKGLVEQGLAIPIRDWFEKNGNDQGAEMWFEEWVEDGSGMCLIVCADWDDVVLRLEQKKDGVVTADVVYLNDGKLGRVLFTVDWTHSEDIELGLTYLWNGLHVV